MKLLETFKEKKTQVHLLALSLYIIGVACDVYGYINIGVEVIAYLFLLAFASFGSALVIIWDINNKRLLKAARVYLSLLILGIAASFITVHFKMYPTCTFTIIFILFIAIAFIKNLCEIGYAYYTEKWD